MENELENNSIAPMAGDDRTTPDTSDYTLTVEEVSELFAEASVPRNPRSIRRFCQNGELDCITIETPTSSRYLVSRNSVDKLIRQKQQALQFSESRTSPAVSGHDRSEPDATGHDRTPTQKPSQPHEAAEPDHEAAIKRLEDELVNLRIDNRGKETVITMLRDERREMLAQIESANYRLGAAETRVAQLEAPKVHADEPRVDPKPDVVEAIILPHTEAVHDTALTPVSETPQTEPRRSFFGRLLG